MDQSERDRLIFKFGFSAREAGWIIKRAEALGITPDKMLLELSGVFKPLVTTHAIILSMIALLFIVDHKIINSSMVYSHVFAYLIACLFIRTRGPIIKAYKAYRALRRK